jgi:hypothetical protein
MQIRGLLFLAGLSLLSSAAFAQREQRQPTSLDPGSVLPSSTKTKQHPKRGSRVLAGQRRRTPVRHTAQYEFYERVERAAKLRQRMLIEQSKHKKSNFGHRKKPRKRPPHKMRYCDECGIRH